MNMYDKCSQIKKIDLAKTFQLTFVIILSHLSSTQQVSEHTQLFMLGHDIINPLIRLTIIKRQWRTRP